MSGRTAVILGSTGLVGGEMVRQLLGESDYGQVVSLGRRPLDLEHEKLEHHIVDFEDRDAWTQHVRGDALFSAMGTTIKRAGSEKAQWRVDHDYQFWAMEAAKSHGVGSAVLVSSTGARADSMMFYLKMKGTLDHAVLDLGIESTTILRPGPLDGDRGENRPMERFALSAVRWIPRIRALSKIRPVHASIVARAALAAARLGPGTRVWEAGDIFEQGK